MKRICRISFIVTIFIALPILILHADMRQELQGSSENDLFLPFVTKQLAPIIPETTKVLTDASTQYLQSVSSDYSIFTFSSSTSELGELNVDDIMVSGPSTVAPYGFLRKVTNVNNSGGRVIITTAFATLEDAVEQGSFSYNNKVTPSSVTSISLVEGVSIETVTSPSGEGLFVELNSPDLGCLNATGSISITNLNIDIGGNYQFFSLNNFRAVVTADVVDDLNFEVVCENEFLEKEAALAQFLISSFVVPIGPVPVVFVGTIDLVIGASGAVKFGASFNGDLVMNIRAGAVYEDGDISLIGDVSSNIDWSQPIPALGLDAKGYAGPEFQLLAYGLSGIFVRESVFLKFESDVFDPNLWTLYWGVEIPVGLELDVFGKEIAQYEAIAISYQDIIAQGGGTAPGDGTTSLVSFASGGGAANGESGLPSISGDGRYVAFQSQASNLVSGDTNGTWDVFVLDQTTSLIKRVSIASDDTQGNNGSFWPSISSDGRYVTFGSAASNLVLGDTNNITDIFVHDLQTGITNRISVDSSGNQSNGDSYSPKISADGRYVVFESIANNIVSGDTNGVKDIFIRDLQTAQTTRVSVSSSGVQSNGNSWFPSVSADGRYVAFDSFATNLVSGDTNGWRDVFVHDRQTGQTNRISMAFDGSQTNNGSLGPYVSANGQYVAFSSTATNLVNNDTNNGEDAFIYDISTGQTSRVSVASDGTEGNDLSAASAITADGRYVVIFSYARNLVDNDTNGMLDVFIHDRQTGQNSLVSVASDGTQGNEGSAKSAISDDGLYVAFESLASNLISGDANSVQDIFIRKRD